MATSVIHRIRQIEDALADALKQGDFEIIHCDGGRYLAPVLVGYVHPDYVWSRPLLSLNDVAREVERRLA